MAWKNLPNEDQLIADLRKLHPSLAIWAIQLLEGGKTVEEVFDAMERMVKYIQNDGVIN